jgi:hypothetical protein
LVSPVVGLIDLIGCLYSIGGFLPLPGGFEVVC